MLWNSWVSERPAAFEEGPGLMELVSYEVTLEYAAGTYSSLFLHENELL
jgi:hypothetical protein